jgi:hypothetical protein
MMDQWYNCPGCQRLVKWGQPQCSSCGRVIDWPKPAHPIVETPTVNQATTQLAGAVKAKTPPWLIALTVVIVLGCIAWVASTVSSQKSTSTQTTATATKPVVDNSPEMQRGRLELISELKTAGVFYKVEKPGTYAHVWVTPLFYALAFEKKQDFIGVVFAYYVSEDPKSELVLLFDSQNGKQVGKYALIYGGLEME